MEPAEAYHKHDNWPPEVERALMIRIASEAPVLQDTLLRLLLIGISKVGWQAFEVSKSRRDVSSVIRHSFTCHSFSFTISVHFMHLVSKSFVQNGRSLAGAMTRGAVSSCYGCYTRRDTHVAHTAEMGHCSISYINSASFTNHIYGTFQP